MGKKIILVVDDEKEIHELIRAYLSHLDVEIYSAYNGKEGVRLYRELMRKGKKPDLVVMDLNLSGTRKREDLMKQMKGEEMDGVRTTEEIMKIDTKANVVGFTAYAHLEWGKKLKKIGVKNVFGREIGFDGFAEFVTKMMKS